VGELIGVVLPASVAAGKLASKLGRWGKVVNPKTRQGRIGKKSEGKGVNTTKLLQSKFPNSAKKYAKHSKEWSKWGPISEKAFCKRAIDLASSPVNNHFKGFISKKWLFVQI
jgi:hypothetical protein